MKQLVVGLMFVGSLCIGAAIQAQPRRVSVVSVECNGNCFGKTLGQLCSNLVGPTFKPFAVDCTNVRDQSRSVPCGNNDRCFQRAVSPEDSLGSYCDDAGGWDAQVYCEDISQTSIQKGYPGTMCQPDLSKDNVRYDDTGRIVNVTSGFVVPVTCPIVRDNTLEGNTIAVFLRVDTAVNCSLTSRGPNGEHIVEEIRATTDVVTAPTTLVFPPIFSVSQGYLTLGCLLLEGKPDNRSGLISYFVLEIPGTVGGSQSGQNESMGQIPDPAK